MYLLMWSLCKHEHSSMSCQQLFKHCHISLVGWVACGCEVWKRCISRYLAVSMLYSFYHRSKYHEYAHISLFHLWVVHADTSCITLPCIILLNTIELFGESTVFIIHVIDHPVDAYSNYSFQWVPNLCMHIAICNVHKISFSMTGTCTGRWLWTVPVYYLQTKNWNFLMKTKCLFAKIYLSNDILANYCSCIMPVNKNKVFRLHVWIKCSWIWQFHVFLPQRTALYMWVFQPITITKLN